MKCFKNTVKLLESELKPTELQLPIYIGYRFFRPNPDPNLNFRKLESNQNLRLRIRNFCIDPVFLYCILHPFDLDIKEKSLLCFCLLSSKMKKWPTWKQVIYTKSVGLNLFSLTQMFIRKLRKK